MTAALLAGCAQNKTEQEETPAMTAEEWTQRYEDAINNCGAELVEYNPPITSGDEDMSELAFQLLGVTEEDMAAYAISLSAMNVQAYTIALILPAEGKEETVLENVNAYVERQQQNFEFYLADQYEIAENARVETLEDGTILLVMAENADEVYNAVTEALSQNAQA